MNRKRREEDSTSLAVLKAWRAAGEPLGSHTWSHPELNTMSAADFTFITLQQAESDAAYSDVPDIGYKGGGALQELVGAERKMVFPPNAKPNEWLEKTCSDKPAK